MSDIKNQESIGGLRANAVAFIVTLSYFIGFGIIFPIVALILEQDNEFVRSYAKQTLAISLIALLGAIFNLILFIGTFLYGIFLVVLVVFQIIATVNAILGKEYEIPYINKVVTLLFKN